jgi:hypothetical protein
MTVDRLRLDYEARVIALRERASAMRRSGSTSETIARAMYAERRELCQVFKEQTPEPLRTRIFARTQAVYDDPLGPSLERLRAQGKSWDDIIDSASRPGRLPQVVSCSSNDGEA